MFDVVANQVVDEIIEILDRFHHDRNASCRILLLLTVSHFKTAAVLNDRSNEAHAEMITTELDKTFKAHFGEDTTREIWKAVFTEIVRFNLMARRPPVFTSKRVCLIG